MQRRYTYLALGDSYTIGEAVPLSKSFPYQAVQLLRKKGFLFSAPEVIAKTGWTTDELLEAVKSYRFNAPYDYVTLLIGVNNQYRQRDVMEFTMELELLIKKAITLSGNKKSRLVVLSIPDYSVTPFAASMNTEKIEKEIDVFNAAIKAICVQYKLPFINVTDSSRKAKQHPDLLTADRLHPSAKEYGKWAKKLVSVFSKSLK